MLAPRLVHCCRHAARHAFAPPLSPPFYHSPPMIFVISDTSANIFFAAITADISPYYYDCHYFAISFSIIPPISPICLLFA
jgi:hypothetical protein